MAADGTVLWKCGACEDCFYDLHALAGHKCIGNTGTITLSEQCIKQLEEQSFSNDIDSTNDQVEQAISAIAAMEEENSVGFIGDGTASAKMVSFAEAVPSKRSRKPKPTIISINSGVGAEGKIRKHQKSKRSLVWAYFTALDHKKAMCCICQKVIAYCGTPTNLVYHLNRFHPSESEVVKSKQSGGAKYQYLNNKIPKSALAASSGTSKAPTVAPKKLSIISTVMAMKKSMTDRVVEMIALDLLPVNIVEGEGFKKFITSLDPTFVMPSIQTVLKDLLPKRYYSEFKKVKGRLANCNKIHLSVELWVASTTKEDFFTVTAHFVTKDFEPKCYVLNTSFLEGPVDYQTITTALLSCISEWDITSNVMCVVTDNSDQVSKAVKVTSHKHVACLAHTLDKIVNDAIQTSTELTNLITKCRNLVSFFKENSNANQKLMEIQTQDKKMQTLLRDDLEFSDSKTPNCPLKMKKDNQNYWISTFYMMQRIFTLRNVINMVLDDIISDDYTLSDDQWTAIEETISLLKAFEVVTLELCSERFPCLSKVIPIVQGLLSLVTNCSSLTLNYVERLRKDLLSQLRRRLGQVEQNITLATATVLDPRFKNIAFQSDSSVDAAVQNITVEGRKYRKLTNLDVSKKRDLTPAKKSLSYTDSLWECFEKKATPRKESCETDDIVLGEVKNYFEEPLLDRKKDPIKWWREYGNARFPILAEIAKQMLSIPSTSMPPERIFLQKEQVFFEKRDVIKNKYMHQFLFLNGNIE